MVNSYDVNAQHFFIKKGGISGYVKAIRQLYALLRRENSIDIIHVHYGLWGLVAVISKIAAHNKAKVVITFHGSDINKRTERPLSQLAARFSAHNILVSEKMLKYIHERFSLIPCGIDTDVELNHREVTRKEYGWGDNNFVVLFSSSFERSVKDPGFAFKVIAALEASSSKSIEFVELKGYNRNQLTRLMQAADALIMCSEREGSPQIVKEAVLNALPVVSNDVGDVKSICRNVDNCYIVDKEVSEYVKCLTSISLHPVRVRNRAPVLERFDNKVIAKRVFSIYNHVLGRMPLVTT